MLKKLSFFLFCFLTTISYSQKAIDIDQTLSAKYSNKEIKDLKETTPEKYKLYEKSFAKGVVLTPYTDKIRAKGNQFESLNIQSAENAPFNYLAYNLDLKDDTQYFLINNGTTLLIIKGIQELKVTK